MEKSLNRKTEYQNANYNLGKIATAISPKVSDSLKRYEYLTVQDITSPVQQLVKISP